MSYGPKNKTKRNKNLTSPMNKRHAIQEALFRAAAILEQEAQSLTCYEQDPFDDRDSEIDIRLQAEFETRKETLMNAARVVRDQIKLYPVVQRTQIIETIL